MNLYPLLATVIATIHGVWPPRAVVALTDESYTFLAATAHSSKGNSSGATSKVLVNRYIRLMPSVMEPNASSSIIFSKHFERYITMRSLLLFSVMIACLPSLLFSTPSNAQGGVFQGLGGSWSGSGTVSLSDGSSERLRCRANYQVDGTGTALQQTLRCASDSYRFDLNSNVTGKDGIVSGTWSETSRNINGSLQGRGSNGQITAGIEAAGFSASLSLTTRGNRQSVSIRSQGDIRNVSISLVRS